LGASRDNQLEASPPSLTAALPVTVLLMYMIIYFKCKSKMEGYIEDGKKFSPQNGY
jgi:hypothetical protein